MLDQTIIEDFRSRVRGNLILPGNDDYDSARSMFNGMIDKKPAMIVQCTGNADVMTCVDLARDNELPISVKGGGHGVAGKAVCDDGIVIDLSLLRSVHVDPDRRIAQVQAGARLGDLDHETQAFGLVAPAGIDSRTGVAGLALGGGNGHVARRFGLTVDNLVAAEIITADGSQVRASDSENPDLLWALKGGGGNFGVVTTFEFRLHPVGPDILTAQAYHLFDDASQVLRFFRDFASQAPDEVGCVCLVMRVPPIEPFAAEHHGKLAVAIVANHSAGIDQGKPILQPLVEFGNPIAAFVMPMPFKAFQCAFNDGYPDGARYYWKSHYLRELSDEAIDSFIAEIGDMPGEFTACGFETMGGAINRVDPGDTAFPHRDAAFSFAAFGGWSDPAMDEEVMTWTRAITQSLEPWSTGGMYVNYFPDDGSDQTRQSYGDNHERLLQIKRKFDPDNLFDAHQRIAVE